MAKAKAGQPNLADVLELLEKLTSGGVTMPNLPLDPATGAFSFGIVVVLLVMKIIDTVPPAQHAENWERINSLVDKLAPIK